MESLFAVIHREQGTVGTFKTLIEAGSKMARLLEEDPSRAGDLWIEPVEAVGNQPEGAPLGSFELDRLEPEAFGELGVVLAHVRGRFAPSSHG